MTVTPKCEVPGEGCWWFTPFPRAITTASQAGPQADPTETSQDRPTHCKARHQRRRIGLLEVGHVSQRHGHPIGPGHRPPAHMLFARSWVSALTWWPLHHIQGWGGGHKSHHVPWGGWGCPRVCHAALLHTHHTLENRYGFWPQPGCVTVPGGEAAFLVARQRFPYRSQFNFSVKNMENMLSCNSISGMMHIHFSRKIYCGANHASIGF